MTKLNEKQMQLLEEYKQEFAKEYATRYDRDMNYWRSKAIELRLLNTKLNEKIRVRNLDTDPYYKPPELP